MFNVHHPKSPSTVPRTIRFTEELFTDLNEIAYKEGISFNKLVLQCCQYAIDNYNKSDEFEEHE